MAQALALLGHTRTKTCVVECKDKRTYIGCLKSIDVYMNVVMQDADLLDHNLDNAQEILIKGDSILSFRLESSMLDSCPKRTIILDRSARKRAAGRDKSSGKRAPSTK